MSKELEDKIRGFQFIVLYLFILGPIVYLSLGVILQVNQQLPTSFLWVHKPAYTYVAFLLALPSVLFGFRLQERKKKSDSDKWKVYLNNHILVLACFQVPALIGLALSLTGAGFWSVTLLSLASIVFSALAFPTRSKFRYWAGETDE